MASIPCLFVPDQNDAIMDFMERRPTPNEFDLMCANIPSFQWQTDSKQGFIALGHAALWGNTPLIEHIVQKGGKNMLEVTYEGRTAIILAVEANQYGAVKKLLDLGAIVHPNHDSDKLNNCTLWLAAKKTQNVAMTKLLLQHGAVCDQCERAKYDAANWQSLVKAQREIAAEGTSTSCIVM